MPKTTTLYGCQICGKQYLTEQDAIICETRPASPRLVEVGDIVIGQPVFGWFDGDPAWVSNPQAKNGDIAFYYVVTRVDGDDQNPHRVRYHLFTKAMTGKEGYRCGFTFNEGHISIRKVSAPAALLVADSKDLIGRQAEHLL